MTDVDNRWKRRQIAAARDVILTHNRALNLEPDNGNETDLWHLLCSLMVFCRAEGIDVDAVLKDVRQTLRAGLC